MLDLGSISFHLAVSSVDPTRLEDLSSSLFDEWDWYVDRSLTLPDYSIFLQIEEGSVIGWGSVKSTAQALAAGVVAYGGLMSGVEIISKQMNSAGSYLAEQAQNTFACAKPQATVKRKGGVPAALQRLFARVQAGELTADEASVLAESILGKDAEEIPGFFETLKKAFKDCPRQPLQTPLPFEETINPQLSKKSNGDPSGPSKRLPNDIPAPLHYRVEVWRESKNKKKQSKLSLI